MKALSLSKPLQAALLLTAAMTAIALLKPDALDTPAAPLSQVHASQDRTSTSPGSAAPWIRTAGEEWQPSEAEQRRAAEAAAAAAAPVVPPAPPMPPPKPTAPDPALTYLGRIDQDGRSYVFLGKGADPQVVEIGSLVDPQWKVEKASATQIELRFLPLNEIRMIPVTAAQ